MRLRTIATVVFAVVLVAVLAVQLTADRRAEGARNTLKAAAARFDACYQRERSYRRCETGSSGVMVQRQTRDDYELISAVEFGPQYSIERGRDGKPQQRCAPAGERCPIEDWSVR